MDTYDALGKTPERYSAFTEGLLAEAEDTQLQTILSMTQLADFRHQSL